MLSAFQRRPPPSPSWTWGDPYNHFWSNGQWIEGNVVVTPKGTLVDILRANVGAGAEVDDKSRKERAAILQISEDGTKLSHDRDLINFVGERSSLRFGMILSQSAIGRSAANRLTLLRTGTPSCSPHHLTSTIGNINTTILHHDAPDYRAFQYVDCQFEGDDLLVLSRTAYDYGLGGAHKQHDPNYFTFHGNG